MGFRLTTAEAWRVLAEAHTGILTTLRTDGVPVATPVWFAVVDGSIYIRTRGVKVLRIRRDPRSSFLVEHGQAWSDLRAVHLTGVAAAVDLSDDERRRVEDELDRKYERFRLPMSEMPWKAATTYASNVTWIRFAPDERILSWDNRALVADGVPTRGGTTS